jgi:3'(2'), 5'-bisphosphate nucleotidase
MISESVINNVKDIAVRAGGAIMDIYKDESKFNVEQKSDDSPLTAADQAANAVIVEINW